MKTIAAAVATAVLAFALMPEARAVSLLETQGTNAAGNCASALPSFEGLIRKRPLGVINEGTSSAFVTCAFTTNQLSLGLSAYSSRISNYTASPKIVTCTGVTGVDGSAKFVTKTLTVGANSSATMTYSALLDNLTLLFSPRLSVSCNLPAGTGVNYGDVTAVLSIL